MGHNLAVEFFLRVVPSNLLFPERVRRQMERTELEFSNCPGTKCEIQSVFIQQQSERSTWPAHWWNFPEDMEDRNDLHITDHLSSTGRVLLKLTAFRAP